MKQKKRDQTWFEQKVGELGEAIKRLPDERQLELFEEIGKQSNADQGTKDSGQGQDNRRNP
jgi:hypothetical protein